MSKAQRAEPTREAASQREATLRETVSRAQDALDQAKSLARQLADTAEDLGAAHPDGRAARRQARQVQLIASRQIDRALKDLSQFVLEQKPPRDTTCPAVVHKPGTAHFRCACGERLVFGSNAGAYACLLNLKRDGNGKIGQCPGCGASHSVANL